MDVAIDKQYLNELYQEQIKDDITDWILLLVDRVKMTDWMSLNVDSV